MECSSNWYPRVHSRTKLYRVVRFSIFLDGWMQPNFMCIKWRKEKKKKNIEEGKSRDTFILKNLEKNFKFGYEDIGKKNFFVYLIF